MDWQALAASLLGQVVVPLVQSIGANLLVTPHVEQDPTVVHLWTISLGVVGGLLGLSAVWLGLGVMARGALPQLPTWEHSVTRLVLAVVQVAAASVLIGRLVDLSNGLALAFTVDGANQVLSAAARKAVGPDPAVLVLTVFVILAADALLVLAVLRVLLLGLLAATAPLALASYAIPALEGLAIAWWRLLGALLALPVLDAILLALGLGLFSAGNGGNFGLPGSGALEESLALLSLLVILLLLPPVLLAKVGLPSRRARSVASVARVML